VLQSEELIDIFRRCSLEIKNALDKRDTGDSPGKRGGQYEFDLIADDAALGFLDPFGFKILSEESGFSGPDSEITVVIDPVDGSSNRAKGINFYATSLAGLINGLPVASLVTDLTSLSEYKAIRDQGAYLNKIPLHSNCDKSLKDSFVGITGHSKTNLGWAQFRAFGAASLEISMVASQKLEAFVDLTAAGLSPWDYLGALLVCREAGVPYKELLGLNELYLSPTSKSHLLVGANSQILNELSANCLEIIENKTKAKIKKDLATWSEKTKYKKPVIQTLIKLLEGSSNPFDRTADPHICVSSIVVSKNKVLVINHERLKKSIQPGGHINANEALFEALRREIKEESGVINVDFKDGILLNIGSFSCDNSSTHIDLCYLSAADTLKTYKGAKWMEISEALRLNDEYFRESVKNSIRFTNDQT
jgi:fructose-1,6-bisphosphatase/inositol monophosphatase family enzyme/ADP-ribose pyrophosphatase YjhB (NUDIX family)